MVDYIKIEAKIDRIYSENQYEPFGWNGIEFKPVFHKVAMVLLKGFEGEFLGLRVLVVRETIQVSNSLHKFFRGNNYGDLGFKELKKAIGVLCERFGIEPKGWIIKKMEIGFNLKTPKAALHYVDLFAKFKGKEFDKMRDIIKVYGRRCYMSEYSLKVYDKSSQTKLMYGTVVPDNILRLEISYNQHRKLPKGIFSLADILDGTIIKLAFDDLYRTYSKVEFKDEWDFTGSTEEERRLLFASMDVEYLKVEKRLNKDQLMRIKAKINQLKEKYCKKGFKEWVLKNLEDRYICFFCN